MTIEKWEKIKGQIQDNFKIEDQGKRHEDDMGGIDIEFIVFNGPLGKIKLEFVAKPVVLDKKTNYSNRIGSETQVEYVYSEDEKSYRFLAYKWDGAQDDWIEMDAKNFDN